MIPNNNISVLPFYTSLAQQNARRWWLYDKVYPLYSTSSVIPFQILMDTADSSTIASVFIVSAHSGTRQNITANFTALGAVNTVTFNTLGLKAVCCVGTPSLGVSIGQYYLEIKFSDNKVYYSEVFTVVADMEPYLKITWWDNQDFIADSFAIAYTSLPHTFKNVVYLQSDIAKPEYVFEEEGETRDGFFFASKQISEKRYRFAFLASEYLLDAMRLVRMADNIQIEYHGQTYNADSFLITPEWESNGDVAVVKGEFDTATVAKKIGMGYLRSTEQ